jgi:hypothetical protein
LRRNFDAATALAGYDFLIIIRRDVEHAVSLGIVARVKLGIEAIGAEEARIAAV